MVRFLISAAKGGAAPKTVGGAFFILVNRNRNIVKVNRTLVNESKDGLERLFSERSMVFSSSCYFCILGELRKYRWKYKRVGSLSKGENVLSSFKHPWNVRYFVGKICILEFQKICLIITGNLFNPLTANVPII